MMLREVEHLKTQEVVIHFCTNFKGYNPKEIAELDIYIDRLLAPEC